MDLHYDEYLDIAIGKNRKEKNWKNKEILWSDLLNKVSKTHRTAERYAEYVSSDKSRQAEIKDIGGFVGGYMSGARRQSGSIVHRQLITLDVDEGTGDGWRKFTRVLDCAAGMYTTHKHSNNAPRIRILVPLDRPVDVNEYQAIARRIASYCGIEGMDPTTYQPERLMYWPSSSKDGEFTFKYQDGPWACADDILDTYTDWQNVSEWPTSSREDKVVLHAMHKQGDPLEKDGLVGVFCRTYSIAEAIETFLSDVYLESDFDDRYTYAEGSSFLGLVVYDDKFAFSHHGTDPISGKLCNAFDLVRIHLYGIQDETYDRSETPITKMPSFKAMLDLIGKDKLCRKAVVHSRLEEAQETFRDIKLPSGEDTDDEWIGKLDCDKNGVKSTIDNIVQILTNDPLLKGKMAVDLFERREVALGNLPWRRVGAGDRYLTDWDDAALRHYLEKAYGITSREKVKDGLEIVTMKNGFHPVRDYLQSLVWDGVQRLDTVFIDYLGAPDSPYTRAVTRKSLIAAVTRVFRPGVKFDNVVTLVGAQGAGKSTILRKLGGAWFSDTLPTIQGKEAYESIQGVWMVEMGELAGLRKAELETIKNFISSQTDRYRVAYGRRTENFPRQSVFFATTNTKFFINDISGGRRWWPLAVDRSNAVYNIFTELTQEEVNQIWAEAFDAFSDGEKIHLSEELEALAREQQSEHSEVDDRIGLIEDFLNTPLPKSWVNMSIAERKNYLSADPAERALMEPATDRRRKTCVQEIWCEVFGKSAGDLTQSQARGIHVLIQHIDGWEKHDTKIKFRIYGVQRGYVRRE